MSSGRGNTGGLSGDLLPAAHNQRERAVSQPESAARPSPHWPTVGT